MLPAQHFLTSRQPLRCADATAAILITEDRRYLLQLRDDIPGIWYPGYWGLFGGAVDGSETEIETLKRELLEELELEVTDAKFFVGFDFNLTPVGLAKYYRNYWEVTVSNAALSRLALHEGAELGILPGDEALALPRIVPYDSFALFMHHHQSRLAR